MSWLAAGVTAAQPIIVCRYSSRGGESYSGSSDEYNHSDPQQYYDTEYRNRSPHSSSVLTANQQMKTTACLRSG